MQLEYYFDFLAPNEIRIKGHRIGIEDVLYEYIYNEMTPPELCERFPTLNLEKIYAVLLYYHQNREKLECYLADWIEFGDRMRDEQEHNLPPVIKRLRQIRAERESKGQPIYAGT